MEKPVILVNWSYYRKDWVFPFLELADQFDFKFISYVSSNFRKNDFEFDQLFWEDYSSAIDLLEKVKPEKIVLMSIDSGYCIALNQSAKSLGITTFVMQHGLTHGYQFYRQQERMNFKAGSTPATDKEFSTKKSRTLKFLYQSLNGSRKLMFPYIMVYLLLSRAQGKIWTANFLKPSFLKSNKYICFTQFNGRIYIERDGIKKEHIIEIGNPNQDFIYAKNSEDNSGESQYYLLIDQPFAENPFNNFGVSKNEMNEFYQKLNKFCLSKGAKLYVKLHPESYSSQFMIEDSNIKYIKEADFNYLMHGAVGVFGTFSSLIIPVIYWKPCCLFKLSTLKSDTQDDIIDLGVVNAYDFKTFSANQIAFKTSKSPSMDEFIHKYIFKTDGKSLERLSTILSS